MNTRHLAVTALLAASLAACGGGTKAASTAATAPSTPSPKASIGAGLDQVAVAKSRTFNAFWTPLSDSQRALACAAPDVFAQALLQDPVRRSIMVDAATVRDYLGDQCPDPLPPSTS